MNRKEQLRKMDYGELQRQPEYKDFLESFVYNASKNMTMEVSYIIEKSHEDSEAPLSYEDIPSFQFDRDVAIPNIIEALEGKDEDEQKELFKQANEAFNRRIKKVGDYEVFLKSLEDDEIKSIAEDTFSLYEADTGHFIDIYQWFIMDERLLKQLEEREEVVLDNTYWGRQSCGQAIELDGIIITIFKEWFLELPSVNGEFNFDRLDYTEEDFRDDMGYLVGFGIPTEEAKSFINSFLPNNKRRC